VAHYLRLSGNIYSVKGLIRGHQHEYQILKVGGIVIITLPISGNTSRAYVLTTAPKVKDWRKMVLLNSQRTELGPYPIKEDEDASRAF
jgi:hypothetical protein